MKRLSLLFLSALTLSSCVSSPLTSMDSSSKETSSGHYNVDTTSSIISETEMSSLEYSSVVSSSTDVSSLIDLEGSYSITSETVRVESEYGQIYTVIYRPVTTDTAKRPAIILSHGYGDSHFGMRDYGEAFAKQGFIAVTYDFNGGGVNGQSSGSRLDMTIFTEESDLTSILDYTLSLEDVLSDNVFLFGASQGGVVSAITANDNVEKIKDVVLLSPAFSLVDDARELFASIDEIPETYFHMLMTVGRNYFASVYNYDVFSDIAAFDKDVLIFHGNRDSLVPLSYSQRAIETYPSATLTILNNEGHMYSSRAIAQVKEEASAFIYAHLG